MLKRRKTLITNHFTAEGIPEPTVPELQRILEKSVSTGKPFEDPRFPPAVSSLYTCEASLKSGEIDSFARSPQLLQKESPINIFPDKKPCSDAPAHYAMQICLGLEEFEFVMRILHHANICHAWPAKGSTSCHRKWRFVMRIRHWDTGLKPVMLGLPCQNFCVIQNHHDTLFQTQTYLHLIHTRCSRNG